MIKRPALRYHGGKWRIAQWVVGHFPKHEVYVEPFGGGASVLLQKQPSRIEVYNDLDSSVVEYFRVLRSPELATELQRRLELTPFSREEHEGCWLTTDDPVENARRLLIRSFQSIGAKGSRERNGWRTRTSKSVWSPCHTCNGWPSEIPAFTARLREVIIERLEYGRVLDIYDAAGVVFYLDPPYMFETRQRDHRKVYVHELSDSDHIALLARAKALKGHVLISGYRSGLYDSELKGWLRRDISARAQTNAERTESLWISPSAAEHIQPSLMEVSA